MKTFWYTTLFTFSKICGSWFFTIMARCIAAGYFLFSGMAPESRRFYAALYPSRSRWRHLCCAFRQYQNFTTIHYDRFLSAAGRKTTHTSEGWQRLDTVIGKEGGILLMSHLGNWEMAATLLQQQRRDLRLLLYMGVKEKEGVEKKQKEELRKSGVTIIGEEADTPSPFSALEGIRFLRSGGLVSMTGDMIWRAGQRRLAVDFLGHRAYVAKAPFVFALVSQAPLFAFFAFRGGKNHYHLRLSKPIIVAAGTKQHREEVLRAAAQEYADMLEEALRQNPLEWYHFQRFIHSQETAS